MNFLFMAAELKTPQRRGWLNHLATLAVEFEKATEKLPYEILGNTTLRIGISYCVEPYKIGFGDAALCFSYLLTGKEEADAVPGIGGEVLIYINEKESWGFIGNQSPEGCRGDIEKVAEALVTEAFRRSFKRYV